MKAILCEKMNILPVNSLRFLNYQANAKEPNRMSFGLKMANPLQTDTVSFGASATSKTAGNLDELITQDLAIKIIKTR